VEYTNTVARGARVRSWSSVLASGGAQRFTAIEAGVVAISAAGRLVPRPDAPEIWHRRE